jgi:hypothetical protein
MAARPSSAGTNNYIYEGTKTGVTAGELQQLINFRFYVNIHSATLGSGCARGQIYRSGTGPNPPTHTAVLNDQQSGKAAGDATGDSGRGGVGFIVASGTSAATSHFWSGVSTTPTAAHIHGLPASGPSAFNNYFPTNGGVVWTIAEGNAVVTASSNNNLAMTAGQLANLDAALYYYNVHTAANANGEIRGQITRARCYPYASSCAPPGTSSSSSSSTGPSGDASNVAVSFVMVAVLAVAAALFQ